MLILSRRENQRLIIGDDIEVVVLGIRGNEVRLGVVAPDDVAVHREEVYLRIRGQQVYMEQAVMREADACSHEMAYERVNT
ncbi:carbon storage regulator CsrA [Perlucidibaca piscinae]|uniref:carbon storage regulator CsrA n=1 Tax=Perlucidibaca piscinae TaxID=392589 RepID=UPI0003B49532|nr:carbon storage regulator CsrA [Perlucidibaca piscinae]